MRAQGAELILDTARFWAARAEWNAEAGRYEYNDVIGPDEYHDHVDNNANTNRMAQWNLQTALEVQAWLRAHAPERAAELRAQLDLTPERLAHWRDVIDKVYLPVDAAGLWEQFDGYFKRQPVDLPALEPRTKSIPGHPSLIAVFVSFYDLPYRNVFEFYFHYLLPPFIRAQPNQQPLEKELPVYNINIVSEILSVMVSVIA
jgi:trehalose/maltose hydrolase-like predicted phosphorylase